MKNIRGFTLIELMIVIAIISILAAIALPSYQEYIKTANRADAKAALLQAQLELGKYRANNSDYGADSASTSEDGFYTITVTTVAGPPATYAVTAAPVSGTRQYGDSCGTFAVTQAGVDHSGSYANASCW